MKNINIKIPLLNNLELEKVCGGTQDGYCFQLDPKQNKCACIRGKIPKNETETIKTENYVRNALRTKKIMHERLGMTKYKAKNIIEFDCNDLDDILNKSNDTSQ